MDLVTWSHCPGAFSNRSLCNFNLPQSRVVRIRPAANVKDTESLLSSLVMFSEVKSPELVHTDLRRRRAVEPRQ